jgi:alanine dehydrogenase
MIIGCPKEIKAQEDRVGVTPAGVNAFVHAGHTVCIQKNAGAGAGFEDDEYIAAGAKLLDTAKEVFDASEMIIKVKEPLPAEFGLFHEGQILFTYLHLAPDSKQTEALLAKKVIGIAYETVQLSNGSLPLLSCMSEIAGRMAVQVGAHLLESPCGGRGVLLWGVPGVEKGRVVIIGGGSAGTSAAKIAVGLGADVTVIDMNVQRLSYLDDIFGSRVQTLMSDSFNIAKSVKNADIVIGCVLAPGRRTPVLVTNEMVAGMRRGSVLIDVAIDQGGSIEAIDRITTHADPYYTKEDGILRYSVANMPGAVARTSTLALTNATLPYALQTANLGAESACRTDPAMMKGLNVYKGALTHKGVADAQTDKTYIDPAKLF